MAFKSAAFLAILFALSLVTSPAVAQVDFSEIVVDGQLTEEQNEILEKLDPLYEHRNSFIEESVAKQMEERREELLEASPTAMREEVDRLKEQAEETYRTEHSDKVEQLEAHEAQLKAIADRLRGKGDRGTDDEGRADSTTSDASDQDLATIFEDVDGELAVYSREGRKVTQNDGHVILQDDGLAIEFCYADSGCEDRSDVDGLMSAGMGENRLHQSDPDKEVVGLRLHLQIHPQSAATASIFVATGHTSDAFGNPFEIEESLFETGQYEPGDTITYDLGKTD